MGEKLKRLYKAIFSGWKVALQFNYEDRIEFQLRHPKEPFLHPFRIVLWREDADR